MLIKDTNMNLVIPSSSIRERFLENSLLNTTPSQLFKILLIVWSGRNWGRKFTILPDGWIETRCIGREFEEIGE